MKKRKMQPTFLTTESYIRNLKRIFFDITPEGAYCVGLISALAEMRNEEQPCLPLLETVARCRHTEEAIETYRQLKRLAAKDAHAE